MTADITGLCRDHSFETAEDLCRRCGAEYCELCLVFPFGASKPLCKECAMAAGGVRSHVSRPALGKRDLRRKIKAFEERRAGRASPSTFGDVNEAAEAVLHDPLAPTEEDLERVPVPSTGSEDGAAFAEQLGAAFDEPPAPSPPAPPAEKPADGVAPPIDWSQPFG